MAYGRKYVKGIFNFIKFYLSCFNKLHKFKMCGVMRSGKLNRVTCFQILIEK